MKGRDRIKYTDIQRDTEMLREREREREREKEKKERK